MLYLPRWTVEKFHGLELLPYERIVIDGNTMTNDGADAFARLLIGDGTIDQFDNTNAHIGVGSSGAAPAVTDVDLIGTDYRAPMLSGYPTHVHSNTMEATHCVFKAEFGTSVANFVWREWGLFNAASGGVMLNRKIGRLGEKIAGSTWTIALDFELRDWYYYNFFEYGRRDFAPRL